MQLDMASKDINMELDSIIANIILTGNGYIEILSTDVAVNYYYCRAIFTPCSRIAKLLFQSLLLYMSLGLNHNLLKIYRQMFLFL